MKKIRIFVILLIFLLLLGAFIINTCDEDRSKSVPTAVKGMLDLRDYDFQRGAIELNGEWEFIPDQLVDSTHFEIEESHIVQVPSLWAKYEINGQNVSRFTMGTYRLKILVNEAEEVLGIKTSNIRMSNTIFINGEIVGSSGKPAEEREYIQHNIPYTAYFSHDNQEIEILVQVANFDYASGGGIVGAIYLGDQESIAEVQESSLLYDWVTITAFLTMFIYFFGSYIHFKKDIEMLYFSLFCFSAAVYYASHGEKVMLSIMPSMDYEAFERIQMLSSITFGIFLLLYFYYSFKLISNKRMIQILCGIGIFLSLTSVLPVRLNSELQMIYSSYLLVVILFTIYIQLKAIRQRAVGAIYLVLTSIAVFIFFIVATLNVIGNYQLNLLPPILPFFILAMLSLFISNRFSDSFLKKEELSNALIRVDQLKDEFLAKTSHEFRTPLHGITAISQSILDKDETMMSIQEREKISLIMGIAQRLSHLVNDILDHSKLKQGELKLFITSVDLYALIHVTTEIFEYMIEKDVKILNRIPRGQLVLADEERLRQILYNLIDNAVKYTEVGTILIESTTLEGKVVINVSDTGIGIPAEDFDSLFDPFQQFENSVGGTGLGLSVTKQLVELQGGEISVRSKVGEGTTFSITLPSGEPSERQGNIHSRFYIPKKEPLPFSLPFRLNKGDKKILIADDDHVNLKVLIDTLEMEPYSIIAVDNGLSVLEEVKNNPDVGLILMDIMMPGMSGYEVTQRLRETYNLSELPVLMLTAAINPEDMIAAFQSGANDFLHKPFVSSELKTRVRNLLLMKESAETITKMEVAFLQAQIKPHFIYNVLNTILSLSYTDLDKSRSMITDFATFLRGSFAFENTDGLVTLDKELTLVQSYVNIQQVRFPHQLQWELDVEENLHCLIPPILLQPLVENAINHGIRSYSDDGKVRLSVRKEEKQVHFIISDNGKGISRERLKQIRDNDRSISGVGLQNIAKRLRHFERAGITIESVEHIGTSVEITFPLIHDYRR